MEESEQDIQSLLYEGLNQPGFLFQDLCVHIIENQWRDIGWRIEAKEYPVSSSARDTRIDIILRDYRVNSVISPDIYAIVE